jgi:hypothetical protein
MTKKSGGITLKLVALSQILALLVAACAAVGSPANVCHATGDPANPYEEITIDSTELLNEHRVHAEDIFPVPVGGCPASPVEVVDGNITICHATSSETNPYEEITVSVNGLNGHDQHEGDIVPAPEGGCPAAPEEAAAAPEASSDVLTVCHVTGDAVTPYEPLVFDTVELVNEHLAANPNDFAPVPLSGCPSTLQVVTDGFATMCHATGDAAVPYEEVSVNVNGLDGHGLHEGDVFPLSEEEGCPASLMLTTDKVTICHATSSAKNPYVRITVSVNGLNGHNKHSDDIIPAPAGGCPSP